MNLRRNIRANLRKHLELQGKDRWGNSFEVQGESVDFSRRGLGLLLDRDIVAPGSVVRVRIPNKLQSNASVQWVQPDAATGKVRLGVRLIDPNVSIAFRLAASILLCLAVLGQMSFARSRMLTHATTRSSCTMSLSQMKDVLEKTLGKYAMVADSDKAFVHLQHQHMTCEEFTRLYEKSDFYPNPKTRAAIANWHWNTYHSKASEIRSAAIQSVEASLIAPK
jgi:hypothetical protein